MSALAHVIPADIRQSALDVVEVTSVMSFRLDQVEVVAAAIIAERERCAHIAKALDTNRGNEGFIAHAIRNPYLPSGAAACSADSPARSNPPPSVSSGTNSSEVTS